MSPQELDVIIRVAGATMLLAIVPALGLREPRLAWIYGPMALCLCGFLAGNTPDESLRLSGPVGHLGYFLTGFAAVFLWWFCLAVFDRAFRPRGFTLVIGTAWIIIAAADRGLMGAWVESLGLSRVLIGLGLLMVAYLMWRLIRDRTDDMVTERRDARVAVVFILAGLLLVDLMADVVMGFDWQPRAFSVVQNAALLATTAWLLWLSFASTERFAEPTRSSAQSLTGDDPLQQRLVRLIEIDRVHLDPTMTFARFVDLMAAPDRSVRHLINRRLGFDHFRSFLNHYRVAEARRLLTDPVRRDDKLIAIALDSGFASLASFNRVFKEVQNCAPSVFRQSQSRF
jgi:AraC-type DNA-binding domain-containing proteins